MSVGLNRSTVLSRGKHSGRGCLTEGKLCCQGSCQGVCEYYGTLDLVTLHCKQLSDTVVEAGNLINVQISKHEREKKEKNSRLSAIFYLHRNNANCVVYLSLFI